MAWCKLEDTFHSHQKFYRLARELDVRVAEARGLCAALWSWAIQHASDGDLCDCDIEDIERVSGWEGDAGACVRAMSSAGLIEMESGSWKIHNWMKRAGSYIEATKKRAQRKRVVKKELSPDCPGTVPGLSPDCPGNVPRQKEKENEKENEIRSNTYSSNTPLDDTVRHENQSQLVVDNFEIRLPFNKEEPEPTAVAEFFGVERQSSNIKRVFSHYRIYRPRSFRKPNSKTKEWSLVKARLLEGYSVEEICRAIDGAFASPWHSGQNDHRRKYQDLELIVRNQAKLAKFLDLAEEYYTPANAPRHVERSKELTELGVELGLGEPTPKELEDLLRLGISCDDIRAMVNVGDDTDSWNKVINA